MSDLPFICSLTAIERLARSAENVAHADTAVCRDEEVAQLAIPDDNEVDLEPELFGNHPPRNAPEAKRVYAEPVSQLRRARHIAPGSYTKKTSKNFFKPS